MTWLNPPPITGSRYPAARDSIQPMSIAPTITPAILSSPPMITMGKTLRPTSTMLKPPPAA